MTLVLDTPWADPDRRYIPRPLIASRLTGLDGKARRLLDQDHAVLAHATRDFAADHNIVWDPYCTHETLPPWEKAVQDASDDELLRINERALSVSDAFIVHLFDDGSAMLGWLLASVLRRAHVIPVLLVAHIREAVSKPLLALPRQFPNVDLQIFRDEAELFVLTRSWLDSTHTAITSGPAIRQRLEALWRGTADQLRQRWCGAASALRADISSQIGMSEERIDDLVAEPLSIADFSQSLGVLMDALNFTASPIAATDEAREILDPLEFEAWEFWAANKREDFAVALLTAVVKERRQHGRPSRELAFLGQPGAWDRFSNNWQASTSSG